VAAIAFLTLPYLWSPWPAGVNGDRVPMGGVSGGGVSGSGAPTAGIPPAGIGAAPNVDLSTMSPREAADRLFNRVMAGLSTGDTDEVESFLPMAIDAYHLVPSLDADGYFHLSLLQQAAGDHQAGLESARTVLTSEPDHLLALYAAGEAARELGEAEQAREYFQRLLDAFDQESARALPEYQEHAGFLPSIRETAREFVAAGGR
jgi:tetratricopeptide (TPR) repeat protein